ncbi:MAG: hypothetical protein ACK5Z2_15075 [Bacteroidota bacterium]|jgi:hypothetical protein
MLTVERCKAILNRKRKVPFTTEQVLLIRDWLEAMVRINCELIKQQNQPEE